jgi:hypothetical protein
MEIIMHDVDGWHYNFIFENNFINVMKQTLLKLVKIFGVLCFLAENVRFS